MGAGEDVAIAGGMAAGSGGAPLVAVVESADLGKLHDLADGWRLGRPCVGQVLAKTEVGSSSVIVGELLGDDAVKGLSTARNSRGSAIEAHLTGSAPVEVAPLMAR